MLQRLCLIAAILAGLLAGLMTFVHVPAPLPFWLGAVLLLLAFSRVFA